MLTSALILSGLLSYTWGYSELQCNDGINDCCDVSDDNHCKLSDLSTKNSTLIFPGGDTACITSASTPYAFQVYPGATDKVLFYFQGGGACWDQNSLDSSGYGVKNTFCRTDALPWPVYGVFDVNDPRNAYRDYTIVNVLYCSGDNHAGNAERNFVDINGNPAVQKGAVNVQSVLTWLKAQQKTGEISKTLAELVVMGCSAGSLASQIWGNEIIRQLNYPTRAAIVLDSYIGFFPPEIEGEMIFDYGICELDFLTDTARSICRNKQANTTFLTALAMQGAPHVPYLFLHSRTDRVQIKYFNYLVDSYGLEQAIGEEDFAAGADAILEQYNLQSNFLVYYVNSDQHCYTPTPYVFFADIDGIGAFGNGNADGDDVDDDIGGGSVDDDSVYNINIQDETMNKWISRTPLSAGKKIYSQCGDCSELLVPKEYWQASSSSGGDGKGSVYSAKSDYAPSALVRQMHAVPHLDSEFQEVDSTFNVTQNIQWTSYTSSLVTVPVLVYTIGLFGVLVFLFFLCMRSSSFAYSRFELNDIDQDEEEYGTHPGAKSQEPNLLPPSRLVYAFLGCLSAAFLLNLLLFVGIAQVSSGVEKGDESMTHLERSFSDLDSISSTMILQAQAMSDLFVTADLQGCNGVNSAVSYLGEYEQYVYEFNQAVSPITPKVESAHDSMDSYVVDQKNGFVFTIFCVVTVSLLFFVAAWRWRSVAGLKFSIGFAVVVTFLGLVFVTLYMIFLIALGDFCMDPSTYARTMVSKGSAEQTVQYYTSCAGENPAGDDLYNAEYASNTMLYFTAEAVKMCPDSEDMSQVYGIAEELSAEVSEIMSIADCAPYKEYWELFFHDGVCSDIFDGLYLVWITQTLTLVFLFGAAVLGSLMYPYMKLTSRKAAEQRHLEGSSHHNPPDAAPLSQSTSSTVSASSARNPMFEMVDAPGRYRRR